MDLPKQQAGDPIKLSPLRDPLKDSDDDSSDDEEAPKAEELPNVVVRVADTTVNPKNPAQKISHKKHFCRYCDLATEQIIRHIEARHSREPEVQRLVNATKGSKERAKLTTLMKNRGNFEHNVAVLRRKQGVLIVVRSPVQEVSATHYYPCTKCCGFFSRLDLWRHRCVAQEKVTLRECKALLATALNKESPILNNILGRMKNDEVTELVKTDPLILRFMNMQLDKYENAPTKIPLVRNRARDIGRLLLHIQTNNPTLSECELQDMIHPERFDIVVTSVNGLAKKGDTTAASLPIKLGQTIEKIVDIVKGLAIRSGDNDLLDKAGRFATLQKQEWSRAG